MINNQRENSEKQAWVRPELRKLAAGSADSQAGPTADGGGGAQGS